MRCLIFSCLAALFVTAIHTDLSVASAADILVASGQATVWKYLDDGSDHQRAWRRVEFDDTRWHSGAAPLGYGDEGLHTQVSFGTDRRSKHITTYFRHGFDLDGERRFSDVLIRLRCDDGAIVYLNGTEVIRVNLPEGGIGRDGLALRALDDVEERLYRRFRIAGELMTPGRNLLAIEVHQSGPTSTDVFLDLDMCGYETSEEMLPLVTGTARATTEQFLKEHRIAAGKAVPDGFLDGGRQATIGMDGRVVSGREVLLVDRSRDVLLRQHLEFARAPALQRLSPGDRAAVLGVYVDRIMSHPFGERWSLPAVELMTGEYAGSVVLLGEVPWLCGAGVCRHRALLFKLLADEAGLDVALVRGNLDTGQGRGGHSWNELHLGHGDARLADVMAQPELRFPSIREGAVWRYLRVDNQAMYATGHD